MSSEQLAACPFCGGKPNVGSIMAGGLIIFSVECSECGAERASDESETEARAFWNTRVTAPTRDGEVGRLREALEAIIAVRVSHYDSIWAGTDRCRRIARAALATQAEDGQ